MKKLFISDLDGTLLNSKAELSGYTRHELQRLINRGINFTIATARTAATVGSIFDGIMTKLPVILMGGVVVYDLNSRHYIKVATMPDNAYHTVLDIMRHYGESGFLYTINSDIMNTYYENLDTTQRRKFYDERVKKYGKPFRQSDFAEIKEDIIYFSTSGSHDRLKPIYEEIIALGIVNIEFYRDIYNKDEWYLKLSDKNASKNNAVCYLKKNYSIDYVTAFGDNLNDLPMFYASDECYAVSNAHESVKAAANQIIESNDSDGVIKKILQLI